MGSLFVRLFFAIYALLVGFAAMGNFHPVVSGHLATLGLRSAFGVLGWLLAGLVVAYFYLYQRRRAHIRALRSEAWQARARISPLPQPQAQLESDSYAADPS